MFVLHGVDFIAKSLFQPIVLCFAEENTMGFYGNLISAVSFVLCIPLKHFLIYQVIVLFPLDFTAKNVCLLIAHSFGKVKTKGTNNYPCTFCP